MKKIYTLVFVVLPVIFNSCIGEDTINDEVIPVIRILNPVQNLPLSKTHQYNASYFNNVGKLEPTKITWSSSNETVATINSNGLVIPLAEGETTIKALVNLSSNTAIEDSTVIKIVMDDEVETSNEKSGTVATTSSYALSGSFTLSAIENTNNLLLTLSNDYTASTSLPGLYVYLTNNPNSIANAHSLGPVTVFNGAHNYTIQNVGINDFSYLLYWCEPFGVKVGGGTID